MNLNLGSGADKLPGWTSVDMNPEYTPDVVHDLRETPLPFDDASADLVYMEMALSQLYLSQGIALLRDCFRLMRPGGTLRVNEFDFQLLLATWETREPKWWNMTRAEKHFSHFHRYGWHMLWDRETLTKHLALAGFENIHEETRTLSAIQALKSLDKRRSGFCMEATKPIA